MVGRRGDSVRSATESQYFKELCSGIILFPRRISLSSGGLWSASRPGLGGPNNSSAGPYRGDAAVNQTSEIGSGLTCARCLFGKTWRNGLLAAEEDLDRRGTWAWMAVHVGAGRARLATGGSLRIGPEVIWAEEAFSEIVRSKRYRGA
jgi:hypothetical protein